MIWVMVFLYNRIKVEGPMLKNRIVYYISGILAMPLVFGLFVGGARGGFKHRTRPLT